MELAQAFLPRVFTVIGLLYAFIRPSWSLEHHLRFYTCFFSYLLEGHLGGTFRASQARRLIIKQARASDAAMILASSCYYMGVPLSLSLFRLVIFVTSFMGTATRRRRVSIKRGFAIDGDDGRRRRKGTCQTQAKHFGETQTNDNVSSS